MSVDAGEMLRTRKWVRYLLVAALLITLTVFLRIFLISLDASAVFFGALYPFYAHRLAFLGDRPRLKAALVAILFCLACLLPTALTVYSVASTVSRHISIDGDTIGKLAKSANGGGSVGSAASAWILKQSTLQNLFEKFQVEPAQISKLLTKAVDTVAPKLAAGANSLVAGMPETIMTFLVVIAALFTLFSNFNEWLPQFSQNPIFKRQETREIVREYLSICASVVIATVSSGLVQATVLGTAALLIGTVNPLLVAAVTFTASFLPLLGSGIVSTVLVVGHLIMGEWSPALGFLVAGALAGVSDNLVAPLVVGSRTSLHPLLSLLSALGAIELIGFFGVFIGPVVAMMFLTLVRIVLKPAPSVETQGVENGFK